MKTMMMINTFNMSMFIMSNNNLSLNTFLLLNSISLSMSMNLSTSPIMPLFTIMTFSSSMMIMYLYTSNIKPNKIINMNLKTLLLTPMINKKTIMTNNNKYPKMEIMFNKMLQTPNNKLIITIMSLTTLLMIINFMTKNNKGPLKTKYTNKM